MILNGCMAMPGHISAKPRPFETIYPSFSIYSRCSTQRIQLNASQHSRCSPLRVLKPVSISSGSARNGCHGSFSRRGSLMLVRASKDIPLSGYRYPVMKKKPRWWWRTLACIPYLMPLHETWMYAETAYSLHPFLEDFEFLTYPFLRFIGSFPGWFLMAYFFVAYLGVVRRKEWPHFFRFHVVMGMLLEITLQVTGTVSKWLPLGLYWGKLGMHFWTALAFSYLFTVLECIRCALAGMYADVPFASDAAYIQIPYD